MGRGQCIISKKDLIILELLYKRKELRLVTIAEELNTKIPIIRDNLLRLQYLGLIERSAKVEKVGVGSYYNITEKGRMVFEILNKGRKVHDVLDRFLEHLNGLAKNNAILKRLYDYIEENRDKVVIFDSKDYEDKEEVVEAYEQLRSVKGEHFIAYAKGVREDTLRVKINEKEWHDLMITYITEHGNTRVLVNCSFDEVLKMVKDKLGFADPNTFVNEMIRQRHAMSRINEALVLPFVMGKDIFAVIGFDDKGILIKDKEASNILEEYFKSLWKDGIEFPELDKYLDKDEYYIDEFISNTIKGTAYVSRHDKLLYSIADRLKQCYEQGKVKIVKDAKDTIIDAYKEMKDKQYLQYVMIAKNNPKMLELSIDYALSIGNTRILANDADKVKAYEDARVIDEPMVSAIISKNFVIFPYRDRYIFSDDALLVDLVKEYFLTLWSNASMDFRRIDEQEVKELIEKAKQRLKDVGIYT